MTETTEIRGSVRISRKELERRWTLARDAMRTAGIDTLILREAHDWLGGYIKWFSDVPATNGYARAAVFHLDEPMTMIQQGKSGVVVPMPPENSQMPGVNRLAFSAAYTSVHYTNDYEPAIACDAAIRMGAKSVGLVGMGSMPYAFVETVRARLGGDVRIVDASDMIDRLKAPKSEEELTLLSATAAMQDAIFERLLESIEPGMLESEVGALAQYEGQLRGSEQGIFMVGSGPAGSVAPFKPRFMQTRRIERGDYIALLIENNGPGGFYTELARTIVLGKASDAFREATATVLAAREQTTSAMRPGATPATIFQAHNAFMQSRGLPPELRLYSHGQGYDMVERPLMRADEAMALQAGMCFSCHPAFETPEAFVTLCDNYIINQRSRRADPPHGRSGLRNLACFLRSSAPSLRWSRFRRSPHPALREPSRCRQRSTCT